LKKIFLILLVLFSIPAFGVEVYVAPLLHIDETASNARGNGNVQADILTVLRSFETGVVLRFNSLRNNRINPPQSITDAISVCRNEQIEYLLYGYITQRTHSIQAEVRLFDYTNRRVMQSFFGMDDSGNYQRLINDITLKVLAFIEETMHLEIITEKHEITRLFIPASLGYWTPMAQDWVDVMFGTVTIGSGIEFLPTDNLFTFLGFRFNISTGFDLKYRLGVGNPSMYEAFSNTLYMTIPARLNMALTRQHGVFLGLGFVYFIEIFSMADKYDDTDIHVFNNVGLNINFGYRFVLNETISLFFRNDFDFLFNERSLVTYSPVIGISIQVYEREVRNRW